MVSDRNFQETDHAQVHQQCHLHHNKNIIYVLYIKQLLPTVFGELTWGYKKIYH